MANPPVIIGSFDNVPAPGSPIKSDWPQEISNYVTALGRGLMGVAVGSAAQSGIGGTPVTLLTGCSVTFTAVTSRTYLVLAWAPGFAQVGANGQQRFAILNGAGALQTWDIHDVPVGFNAAHFLMFVQNGGLAGSSTFKLAVQTTPGTITTTAGFLPVIAVFDMGGAFPT